MTKVKIEYGSFQFASFEIIEMHRGQNFGIQTPCFQIEQEISCAQEVLFGAFELCIGKKRTQHKTIPIRRNSQFITLSLNRIHQNARHMYAHTLIRIHESRNF